jgi:hypothetical protein
LETIRFLQFSQWLLLLSLEEGLTDVVKILSPVLDLEELVVLEKVFKQSFLVVELPQK